MVDGRVGHVGGGPVDCVHLAAEGVNGGVGEDTGDAVAGAAPDYRWRDVVVPYGDLGEDFWGRCWRAEVE